MGYLSFSLRDYKVVALIISRVIPPKIALFVVRYEKSHCRDEEECCSMLLRGRSEQTSSKTWNKQILMYHYELTVL